MCLTRTASWSPLPPHACYVWQLRWTPALAEALRTQAGAFRSLHILTADMLADGKIQASRVDWRLAAQSGAGLVPVIRIEGRLAGRADALLGDIAALVGKLPPAVKTSVEIDYDSPTARLQDYAAFLRALRARLPTGTPIIATALPSWLASGAFRAVAEAADLLVLQLHAVEDPRLGVFDHDRALSWVRAMDRAVRRPFLVALPAYGARVAMRAGGRDLSVSSERPALDGVAGSEIAASPQDVAALLADLRRDPPDWLRGFVWFRLPTREDRRAWSAATLRAVLSEGDIRPRLQIALRRGTDGDATDIFVRNTGDIDAPLPAAVSLPAGCDADGTGEFELDGARLLRRGGGLLRGHSEMQAGWIRCANGEAFVHAQD